MASTDEYFDAHRDQYNAARREKRKTTAECRANMRVGQARYWNSEAGVARRAARIVTQHDRISASDAAKTYWNSPAGMLRRAAPKVAKPVAKPFRRPGQWSTAFVPEPYVPPTASELEARRVALLPYAAYPAWAESRGATRI
jgi:hypothetical protein